MLRVVRSLAMALLLTLLGSNCHAQITAPGMGNVNMAAWWAVGLKQRLNTEGTVVSTTYLGMGRTSRPDDYDPVERPMIYVVNEEIAHRFHRHWQYSVALSYRWQERYLKVAPYEHDLPAARQELRLYGRFAYLTSAGRWNFSTTVRPELRWFLDPDFSQSEQRMQFRARTAGKVTYKVNSSGTQRIIGSVELLFATELHERWEPWNYTETRFNLYYSINIPKPDVTFNIGYMNNLVGSHSPHDAHYLSFDVVFRDVFSNYR